MMYLVDLDDTPGYTLTVVQQEKDPSTEEEKEGPDVKVEQEEQPTKPDVGEAAAQADQILANARAQLDALAAGVDVPQKQMMGAVGGLLLAGSVTTRGAVPLNENAKSRKGFDEEQGAFGGGGVAGAASGGEDAGDDAGPDNGGEEG